jgi:thiol:disulfide interchange protein DsbC
MKRIAFCLMFAVFAVSAAAQSGEALVQKVLEDKLKTKIDQITPSRLPGIYEVLLKGQSFYVDEKASYLIMGTMIDLKSMNNVSADSRAKWLQKQYSKLPLESAIKVVRGSGKNILVTFEDPHCGYCKKLAVDLQKAKDITVYTFLLPVLGPNSESMARSIWCAPDRAKAWVDWMTGGVIPVATAKCDADVTLRKTMELGQRFGIQGTPFLIFPNGDIAPGYLKPEELEKRFKPAS